MGRPKLYSAEELRERIKLQKRQSLQRKLADPAYRAEHNAKYAAIMRDRYRRLKQERAEAQAAAESMMQEQQQD